MKMFCASNKFEVPTNAQVRGGVYVDKSHLDEFWKGCSEIAEKKGCYVFSIWAAKGGKPFYVGKTDRQNFQKECFNSRNLLIYNEVLNERKRGRPFLTFIYPESRRGRTATRMIDECEDYLIAKAARRNADLKNSQKLPRSSWGINGVLNSARGQTTKSDHSFKKLMGIG